jgi:hypothetical protein
MCSLMILQQKVKERLNKFELIGLQFFRSPIPSRWLHFPAIQRLLQSNPISDTGCEKCLIWQLGFVGESTVNGCINRR